MSELTCLELSVILWLVHVLCQAGIGTKELSARYLFSSRDKSVAPSGVMVGRATRALANYVENLVPFAALDLALIATQHSGAIWPMVWILARIVYLPLYLFDVIYVRSIAWGVGLVAMLMMLARLAAS
jgi:uncharacterized MAPEG superfamily protein